MGGLADRGIRPRIPHIRRNQSVRSPPSIGYVDPPPVRLKQVWVSASKRFKGGRNPPVLKRMSLVEKNLIPRLRRHGG